ncbi:hypothetical protein BJP39_03790 [Streptomyces sp. CC77]|nr:hypothetical protein BJP39_03790 [Streptomyces sp. CC77]
MHASLARQTVPWEAVLVLDGADPQLLPSSVAADPRIRPTGKCGYWDLRNTQGAVDVPTGSDETAVELQAARHACGEVVTDPSLSPEWLGLMQSRHDEELRSDTWWCRRWRLQC